jgi:hypothetical protein
VSTLLLDNYFVHINFGRLVLKEGGHLVATTQPVSPEETARHRVSGAMMRLAPSGDVLGRIARLLEEGTIRPALS